MNYIYLFFAAVIPPLLIGLYLYYRDKYTKEPLKLILRSFFLGWLIVLPILGIHYFLDWTGSYAWIDNNINTDSIWKSLIESFIMASILEEGFKYFAFKKGIWKSRYFDEFYDGIFYAALISLGFATLENIFYVFDYGIETGLTRAVTAIPAHAFFGITMGFYFGLAKFKLRNRRKNLILAFVVPVILHGLYDLIVFEIARLSAEDSILFDLLAVSFWVLMIGMLLWSLRRIKRLLKRDANEIEINLGENSVH